MGWTAHGTGSQRVSSGCTAGLPLRLAMATAVAVIIVMPSPSAAQEPPETPPAVFQDLPLLVNLGDRITVTDNTGRELRGRIIDLSPSTLSLLVDGIPRDLDEADVTVIRQRQRDSLKNGALYGFVPGAVVGGLFFAGGASDYPIFVLGIASLFGLGGAAIGAGVDALMESQQVIYDASASAQRLTVLPLLSRQHRRVSVAPLLSRDRKGVAISLGF